MTTIDGSELGVNVWLGTLFVQQDQPLGAIPGSALLFGLLLVAAITGGYVAHIARIPRVVGYLLAGVALKTLLHYYLDIDPKSESGLKLSEETLIFRVHAIIRMFQWGISDEDVRQALAAG